MHAIPERIDTSWHACAAGLPMSAGADIGAVATGLATMYVMDAIRRSGEQKGTWENPQHVQLD
jgi:hypothetical protein